MKRWCLILIASVGLQTVMAAPPASADLADDTPAQSRDLSLPGSRIVVNPFNFNESPTTTASAYSNRSNLPLNVGFLATERTDARRIPGLLAVYRWQGVEGARGRISARAADLRSPCDWPAQSQAVVDTVPGGVRFGVADDADPVWQYMSPLGNVEVDMDRHPTLVVAISASSGDNWALKVRNESGDVRTLRSDAPGTGRYEFRLSDHCPWVGRQRVTFELYSVGRGSWIEVGRFELVTAEGDPIFVAARSYTTAWTPHALPFRAFYGDGASLSGSDYFYDGQTLVRRIAFDTVGLGTNPFFVVAGPTCGRSFSFRDGVFVADMGTYSVAVASDAFRGARVNYYRTLLEAEYQSRGTSRPSEGYWAVVVDARRLPRAELLVSVSFAYPGGADRNALAAQARAPFDRGDAAAREAAVQQFWNDYLAKVPEPTDFTIRATGAQGVTPQEVRDAYYRAWVFVGQSLLDPDPVPDRYPYPPLVTGKPSMWDVGDERAPYSATWESLFGIQLYGFIDPATAWSALEGLLSLTDAEGVIGGESLPSRKAQTAWILYNMTGDTARLARVRGPLERYLAWRLRYPHWILGNEPDPSAKDAEFVFSALADIRFMERICEALGDPNGALVWQGRREIFFRECLPWFWVSPDSLPVQYYNTETGVRSLGAPYWVTTGLVTGMLEESYLRSMLRLFDDRFDPMAAFGGGAMGQPKYPDISYTVYGLLRNGRSASAAEVVDACLRDVVRAGWFAEQYEMRGALCPSGVRPSLFGAAMTIDFTLLKNGFCFGAGEPVAVRLPGHTPALRNLRYGDRTLDIAAGAGDKFTFSGSYLVEPVTRKMRPGDCFPIRDKASSSGKK